MDIKKGEKFNMKYKKTVITFSCIFVFIFVILFFLLINYQKESVIKANEKNLQLLANEKASQINLFLESQKEELFIIASTNVFKEAILYPSDELKISAAKNRINELKDTIPGISLMNSEGIVSTGDIDLPGTDYSQHPYYLAKRQDIMFTRYYDPLRKGDYYAIIGPIYDNTDKSKIIGRIAFDIELEKISALMKETLESSEEIYLIDETGLLLSSSKFIDGNNKNGILIQEVKSDGAKACLDNLRKSGKNDFVEQHNETVFEYTNYMGDEVFGAHAYVPNIMGCVIAEKGADELLKFDLVGYITKNIFKKEVKDEN